MPLFVTRCGESRRWLSGRVAGVVKLFGVRHATAEFREHPKIINACSDSLVVLFGEKGMHARSAVGVGISAEIEGFFKL